MPSRAHRPSSPPPAVTSPGGGSTRLSSLAQALARAGRDGHAALVGIAPCGGGAVDLHLRAVQGDVVDALAGWRPPPTWSAIGLLAPAAEVRLVGTRPPAGPDSPVGPVGTALLVGRDGSAAAALADQRSAVLLATGPQPTTARAEELCRRALGLPTPPCTTSPRRLWVAVWLDAITGLAADRPASAGPLRWAALVALHPLRAALSPGTTAGPGEVERLAAHPVARTSWRALRQATAAALLTFPDTPPSLARWFDDGSFGRWLEARYPKPEHLLAALADLLAPGDHAALARVAAAWGVGAVPDAADVRPGRSVSPPERPIARSVSPSERPIARSEPPPAIDGARSWPDPSQPGDAR